MKISINETPNLTAEKEGFTLLRENVEETVKIGLRVSAMWCLGLGKWNNQRSLLAQYSSVWKGKLEFKKCVQRQS